MYIKLTDNVPSSYSLSQLRRDNPQVSFPKDITDACAAEYGVYPMQATAQPAFNPMTQSCTEATTVLVDGAWTQMWSVTDLDPDTVAANQMLAVAALQTDIVDQTQARLDAFARTRKYDSILSACTYATSAVPKFQGEGQYAVNARDSTWATLYTLMAEVQSGTRPMPTSFTEVETLLPALAWPT